MGSCMYYLKADECTKYNFYKIEKLIQEGSKAEDFWQENRGIYNKPAMPREEFWKKFQDNFPMVSEYLTYIKKFGGDSNNELAGYLNFGHEDDFENLEFIDEYKDDNNEEVGQIKYSAYVWHLADWTGFMKFLQSKFKVRNARWLSEEDIDPNDVL